MRLTMQERKTVTKAMAEQYRRAVKKKKGQLLGEFIESTGYNRVYGAWLLRNYGRRVEVAPGVVVEGGRCKRKRPERSRRYGPEVVEALRKVWKIQDYPCGKRLAAALPEVVPRLVALHELRANKKVQANLMAISPATIDRLLKPSREKLTLPHRGGTKPGTLLKHQIAVRTFADWDNLRPGFLEIDLVAHNGGSSYGEYCQTLDATDVATGWSEQMAVLTKAQCHVLAALKKIRERVPFPLLGIDSDNGGEFINHPTQAYCEAEHITFTRSRANRKNDNCFIEQKNWSIVRRFVGYGRYESEQALECLNRLYEVTHDYVNFFQPSMKLIEKVRDGARLIRRYDKPKTPYQRVLLSTDVDPGIKRTLTRHYQSLNPAALHREIERNQKELVTLTTRRSAELEEILKRRAASAPAPDHAWRKQDAKGRPANDYNTSPPLPPLGEAEVRTNQTRAGTATPQKKRALG